jgi:MFS family permease
VTGTLEEPAQSAGFAASPLASLRFGRFRLLMLIQLGNAIGVWAQVVAGQWILTANGASATVVALVPAAMSLPFLVFALPMGVIVSQVPREKLMAGAMGLAAGSSGFAFALSAADAAGPVTLIGSVGAIGVGLVTIGIAWQSLLPETVDRANVASAAILDGACFNTARAIGPVLAGIGLSLIGPTYVFGLNTLLFAACGIGMALLGRRYPSRVGARAPLFRAIGAGIQFARHSPWTKRLLFRMVMFGIPSSCLWALLPVVAHEQLGLQSVGFGLMTGMLGVGAVAGTVLIAPIRGRMSINAFALLGTVAYAAVLLVMSLVSQVEVVVAVMVVGGAAWVGVQSTWMMLAHQALPTWVRPRIVAMILFLFQGTQAVGALFWGAMADRFGLSEAIGLAAAMMLLSGVGIVRRGLYPSKGIEPDPAASVPATRDEAFGDRQVLVEVSYTIPIANDRRFLDAMDALRLSRLRLGARDWNLLADPRIPGTYVECYFVRRWSDYHAQETERLTLPEMRLRDQVALLAAETSAHRLLVVVPTAGPTPLSPITKKRRKST